MSFAAMLFYGCGALAVVFALAVVMNTRNIVASALSLVVTMVALAVIYVLLEAHFVAAIQVMVYAGAIVVLFLFAVMLLNLERDGFAPARRRLLQGVGVLVGALTLAQVLRWLAPGGTTLPPVPTGFGGYRALGIALYTDYVLLVELISLLLLAAIVGALILAQRRQES